MNKKKTIVLALAGLLSAGAFGGVLMNETGGIANVFANDNADAVLWKHYAAVAPTFTSHGSKEFWANCSSLGVHQLEAPTKGTIEEGGDFSATTYFKELTAEDDRYVAKLTPKVTFDSNGGTAIESQDVEYNALATEPTAPTREADEYYDSYAFDGWYANGKKFDFTKPVAGNVDLAAKWTYGKSKTVAVADNWTKDKFTIGENATIMSNIRGSFNTADYGTFKGDSQKLQAACDEFGYKDSDGICFFPTNNGTGSITAPNIDFKSLLKQYGKIHMSVGNYNGWNSLYFNNGTEDKKISSNGSDQGIKFLTRTSLTLFMDGDEKVHMAYYDSLIANPWSSQDSYGDIILSDAQANGTSGLVFKHGMKGASRFCWLGRPYAFAGGAKTVLDVSSKMGYTVTDAESKTMAEASGIGWGQWKNFVLNEKEGIGLYGSGSGSSVLTFDRFDFSSLFEQGKGVKFTIGMWNGNEHIYYGSGEGKEDLGPNMAREGNDSSTYTREQMIDCTYLNWTVFVDSVGVRVHNSNEDKDYYLGLSADQRQGEESLVFSLCNVSRNRLILVSNWTTYQA